MIFIGQGSNGKVHTNSKNSLIVIKTIHCCPCKKIFREVYFSKSLSHPNILQSLQITFPHENIVQITYPRKRMNLQNFLHKYYKLYTSQIPLQIAREFQKQIINTIEFLHFHQIVHRDLKLDNFLIGDYPETFDDLLNKIKVGVAPNIYLSDFGTMKFVSKLEKTEKCYLSDRMCSLWLQPLEILNFQKSQTYDLFKIDVWCVGCILFAIYFGFYPFSGETRKEMRIKINTFDFSILNTLEESEKTILKNCLEITPETRIYFHNNTSFLKHHILKKEDTKISGNVIAFLNNLIRNLCKTEISEDFILHKTLELLEKFKRFRLENYHFELAILSLSLDLCSHLNINSEEIKNISTFYRNKLNSRQILECKKRLFYDT